MNRATDHWDAAYAKGCEAVSWFESAPRMSLEIISALSVPRDAAIIDVGGGASPLAGELVRLGYGDVTVMDLSAVALEASRRRVGSRVTWLCVDVLSWRPARLFGLWHDRAFLQFLTNEVEQQAYLETLGKAVCPGGFVIVATFAPEGPEQCSGLPVRRYSASDLCSLLGASFTPRFERQEIHVTPRGARQPFTWVAFERASAGWRGAPEEIRSLNSRPVSWGPGALPSPPT
jgi:SAM-dependent methyltransferase